MITLQSARDELRKGGQAMSNVSNRAVKEALESVYDVLSIPEWWTKGSNARDEKGRSCSGLDVK